MVEADDEGALRGKMYVQGDDDEPEWMIEFAKRDSRRTIAEKRQAFETRLAKIKQDEERLKQAQDSQDRPRKKQVCTYDLAFAFACMQMSVPTNLLLSGWTSQSQYQRIVWMMIANLF